MKKTPRDIITLHICTKNYDHMMYGSETWYVTDVQEDRWMVTEKATYRGGCPA